MSSPCEIVKQIAIILYYSMLTVKREISPAPGSFPPEAAAEKPFRPHWNNPTVRVKI